MQTAKCGANLSRKYGGCSVQAAATIGPNGHTFEPASLNYLDVLFVDLDEVITGGATP
ncbi:MAG: hypothetical protein ACYDDO_04570 [Acidiferrobacterales bacterium]